MKRLAFTLIELLVVIVLFSLLLATALYSFRFISINIKNINNTNPKRAIYYDLLRNSINSMYFYVTVPKLKENMKKAYYHYFIGKKHECFYVSTSSFYSDTLVLVHLEYKDGTLWYEEGDIFKKDINYLDFTKIKMQQKIRLIEDLKSFKFSYMLNEKESMHLLNKLPSAIMIKMKEQNNIVYIFAVKAKNDKHLKYIKFGE